MTGSDSHPADPHRHGSRFSRWIGVRPGEWTAVLLAAAYYFLVLSSYYMLRPVRETMGIQRGYENVPWLMTGTMLAMLAVNPLYAAMIARWPRRVFVPLVYRFFSVNMLAFFGLFALLPREAHVGLGYAFFIWLSVFNLFVVSVFWSVMADRFTHEQGKRLFARIAVGGTIGAMSGAMITTQALGPLTSLAARLGDHLQPQAMLMLAAIVPLELAVQCMKKLTRGAWANDAISPIRAAQDSRTAEPGPGVFTGLRIIAQSRYLQFIGAYMLLYTLTSTLLYMQQARIVEETFADDTARTVAFARIDFFTNALTLTTQVLITSRLLAMVGVGRALCILPLVTLGGFAWLWASPGFGALAAVQVVRRGLHYAVDRPAREILYTIVSADAKYKSKSFIDTFVYRGGDFVGGWLETWLKAAGRASMLMPLALGASVAWLAAAATLAVLHQRNLQRLAAPKPGQPSPDAAIRARPA